MDRSFVIEEVQLWKPIVVLVIIAIVAQGGSSLAAQQITIAQEIHWILYNAPLAKNVLQIVEFIKYVELEDTLALL